MNNNIARVASALLIDYTSVYYLDFKTGYYERLIIQNHKFQTAFPRKGSSKNLGLVMRREILFQIEGQKTQESFVAFKISAR